jgi:hypothetical protein
MNWRAIARVFQSCRGGELDSYLGDRARRSNAAFAISPVTAAMLIFFFPPLKISQTESDFSCFCVLHLFRSRKSANAEIKDKLLLFP